jgi:hypothetical protein
MDVMLAAAVVGGATPLVTAFAATIASRAAVKQTLNGTVARVERIEKNVADHEDRHLEVVDRLARIETKLDHM